SASIGMLMTNSTYWYTFRITNCSVAVWGDPAVSFETQSQPLVNNAPGATNLGFGVTALQGTLTEGGVADITFFYGLSDGGTNPAAWDNALSIGPTSEGLLSGTTNGFLYGLRYYYRTFASNALGFSWATNTETFKSAAPAPTLGVRSGLRIWYDADDLSTLWQDAAGTIPVTGSGQDVARWDDKSGNDFHVAEISGANPTYAGPRTNLNDRGALFFMVDELGRANDIGITGNADRTLITVYADARNTGLNYQHAFHQGSAVANQTYGHSVYRTGGEIGNHYWGAGFNTIMGSAAPTIVGSAWDGDGGTGANGLDIWTVNGMFVGASDRAPLATGIAQLRVGSRITGPIEGIEGHIAEILMWDRVLTSNEAVEVGNYLSEKYAIPTAYPPMPGATPLINSTATFVTASSAILNADLRASGSVWDVTVYWGSLDGGTNTGGWANSLNLGWFTNGTTNLAQLVGSIAPSTNWYTFRATNCAQDFWATPSSPFVGNTNVVDQLILTKSASPTMLVGTSVTYTIEITNVSPMVVGGIMVTDVMPAGVTFVTSSPSPVITIGATNIFDLGFLASSNGTTVVIDVVMTNPGPFTVVNTASVGGTNGENFLVNNTDSATVMKMGGSPDQLALFKTANPTNLVIGSNVTYTLLVTNVGAIAVSAVVTDVLPADVSFVTSAPMPAVQIGQTNVFGLGTIPA
ncbi:MAG: DUF11 domain-containing protein, partial [Verrucomicrobiota bacterium]